MSGADNGQTIGLVNGDQVKGRITFDIAVLGAKDNIRWDTGAVTELTRYTNGVTSINIRVGGELAPVRQNRSIRSDLQLHNDQRQVFSDGSRAYYFDRYILTVFDVPGFGLDENLFFFQLDFHSLSHTELPTLFVQGPRDTVRPDVASLQPYPSSGERYAGGRFAPTSDNRNLSFRVDSFEVVNVSHINEPSTIALFALAMMMLLAAVRSDVAAKQPRS